MPQISDTSSTDIGKALGRIPSGCAILTARMGTRRTGMLASWVQQAAFEPPAISVAIKKGRPIVELIEESRGFVVNVIGESTGPMFKHFGKGFGLGEEAFAGLAVRDLPAGVVLEDCIAHLSARVISRCEAGDHWVYVGQVMQGGASDAAPYVHLRKNGLSY